MSIQLATDESFAHLARQMGKVVDQLNRGFYGFMGNESWTPNVNVYETEGGYQVCVDLAGVDKDKIDIVVHEHRLTLRGWRATPMRESGNQADFQRSVESPPGGPRQTADAKPAAARRTRVHVMEIDHGPFVRIVELPADVDAGRISAEHHNGILWIELPKK